MILASTFAAAFLTSAVACALMVTLGPRLGFIDRPGAEKHKLQGQAVPYGGGIGMALGLGVAVLTLAILGRGDPWLLSWGQHDRDFLAVLIGAGCLFALGLYDDLRPMRARYKFLIQIAVIVAALWWSGIAVPVLAPWPWLAIAVAGFWCLLLTNAYNLMDHADGLSATMGAISLAVLLTISLEAGDTHLSALWLGHLGVLAGFLIWNRPPAWLYMGDAGSLPLGFLIAVGCLLANGTPLPPDERGLPGVGSPLSRFAPLLIAAIPLYDMAVVILKRWRRRKPLFKGDRGHISHRLSRLGLKPWAGLAVVAAMQLALAGCAILLRHGELMIAVIVATQALSIFLIGLLMEATRDHET